MNDTVFVVYGYVITLCIVIFEVVFSRLDRKLPIDMAVLARRVLFTSRHSEEFGIAVRWLILHADYSKRDEVEMIAMAICRNVDFFRTQVAMTQKITQEIRKKLSAMNCGPASNIHYALEQI